MSQITALGDDAAWSSRCWFWERELSGTNNRRPKKQRNKEPIILAGHGISLRVENGSLLIRSGLTHCPQKPETYRYFRGELNLPERIILLDCSGSISFHVISWLAEQNIPLIQINWKGEIICLAGTSAYSANPERVRWQIESFSDKNRRIEFAKSIVTQKIEASIATLEKSIPRSEKRELAIEAAYSGLGRLEDNYPKSPLEIMALEANCAAAYFRSWVGIQLNWRGTKRRPIPESWRQIGPRSSPFQMSGNHNAAHPVNAMLNYGYAVLESQIRIKAISEGYDPTLGIMHHGRDKSSKFVFDLMEPERPTVDRKILEFVKNNVFDFADFTIRSDGVCRLNPELSRLIARNAASGV